MFQGLVVYAFVLAFMRLHPAAIPLKPGNGGDEALPGEEEEGDSNGKFNNLPTVIEFLQDDADEIKKPPVYTY